MREIYVSLSIIMIKNGTEVELSKIWETFCR